MAYLRTYQSLGESGSLTCCEASFSSKSLENVFFNNPLLLANTLLWCKFKSWVLSHACCSSRAPPSSGTFCESWSCSRNFPWLTSIVGPAKVSTARKPRNLPNHSSLTVREDHLPLKSGWFKLCLNEDNDIPNKPVSHDPTNWVMGKEFWRTWPMAGLNLAKLDLWTFWTRLNWVELDKLRIWELDLTTWTSKRIWELGLTTTWTWASLVTSLAWCCVDSVNVTYFQLRTQHDLYDFFTT